MFTDRPRERVGGAEGVKRESREPDELVGILICFLTHFASRLNRLLMVDGYDLLIMVDEICSDEVVYGKGKAVSPSN